MYCNVQFDWLRINKTIYDWAVLSHDLVKHPLIDCALKPICDWSALSRDLLKTNPIGCVWKLICDWSALSRDLIKISLSTELKLVSLLRNNFLLIS